MAEIMGYPLGICQLHGPKLAVNGIPTCIKCQAKEDNANRVLVVSKVEDPGEDYFKNGKVNPQMAQPGVADMAKKAIPQPQLQQTNQVAYSFEAGLQDILNILAHIPMPSSMKQYKLLLSIKQKIEQVQQEG